MGNISGGGANALAILKKIEELETSLEIKEGTLIKKDGYDVIVKGGEYYKHIFKFGKIVVFSFVFLTKPTELSF